jgi:virginiamycin A acetyltransferase
MCRVFGRNEYESVTLRRYFERQYGIKVGLYSIGAFDRWRIPPGTVIGRYCSIAKSARLLDANHPVDALSTHPFFYVKEFGLVDEDQAQLRPPVVEDDVWLGHNCIITPSCHRIGRGAIVGAGAVVMSDVPPYAIMAGAPARLIRYRFSPETIAALEASEWWRFDKDDLKRNLARAEGFALAPSRETGLAFLTATGRADAMPPLAAEEAQLAVAGAPPPPGAAASLMRLLKQEIPNFKAEDADRAFQDLEIDSFGLINLRLAIEKLLGAQISDRVWGAINSPADLLKIAGSSAGVTPPIEPSSSASPPAPRGQAATLEVGSAASVRPAGERRFQHLNMPQMALSGLSESWTFKEIGDLHWSVLTRGLRTPSAAVCDSEGNRLYATFTRICFSSEQPLTTFRENDVLTIDLDMTRFGAGMFFSTVSVEASTSRSQAHVMTSFSRFGEAGANTSLLKGQPLIPDDCEIQSVDELPTFAQEYRARRAADLPPPLFECEYEILPPHDINGVGLLYFAAYPIIVDICALKHAGRSLTSEFSTTFRDVYYFANSTPDETLVFRIYRWDRDPREISFDATLSRKSDGKVMAWVKTVKQRTASQEQDAGPKDDVVAVGEAAAGMP